MSLSIWSSTKLRVASLPLDEVGAFIRRVASSSFLLGRMSGQQQPTTWYAYYSEKAGREYYHDPVRGVSTWILPDDEHENPLDHRFRTIIRRPSGAVADSGDTSAVSYMRFLAVLILIVPLCWNSMSSSSSQLAEEIEAMNTSLDNAAISEAWDNWESLNKWDDTVAEEEEEVAEYVNASAKFLMNDNIKPVAQFARPVAPPSLQEDVGDESELVEKLHKPKERVSAEEEIMEPNNTDLDLDLGTSKQILEWLEAKMAQSGYVVARVEPSQVPLPTEPVLIRPPSSFDGSMQQKKRFSFRYNCNLPLARVFQKRCRDQKVDMDAEKFAHEMMV